MQQSFGNNNLSSKNEENDSPLNYFGMYSQENRLSDKNRITHESQFIKSYEDQTNHKGHKYIMPDYQFAPNHFQFQNSAVNNSKERSSQNIVQDNLQIYSKSVERVQSAHRGSMTEQKKIKFKDQYEQLQISEGLQTPQTQIKNKNLHFSQQNNLNKNNNQTSAISQIINRVFTKQLEQSSSTKQQNQDFREQQNLLNQSEQSHLQQQINSFMNVSAFEKQNDQKKAQLMNFIKQNEQYQNAFSVKQDRNQPNAVPNIGPNQKLTMSQAIIQGSNQYFLDSFNSRTQGVGTENSLCNGNVPQGTISNTEPNSQDMNTRKTNIINSASQFHTPLSKKTNSLQTNNHMDRQGSRSHVNPFNMQMQTGNSNNLMFQQNQALDTPQQIHQNKQNSQLQTTFINHGDINININIQQSPQNAQKITGLANEQLNQIICQNLINSQQESINKKVTPQVYSQVQQNINNMMQHSHRYSTSAGSQGLDSFFNQIDIGKQIQTSGNSNFNSPTKKSVNLKTGEKGKQNSSGKQSLQISAQVPTTVWTPGGNQQSTATVQQLYYQNGPFGQTINPGPVTRFSQSPYKNNQLNSSDQTIHSLQWQSLQKMLSKNQKNQPLMLQGTNEQNTNANLQNLLQGMNQNQSRSQIPNRNALSFVGFQNLGLHSSNKRTRFSDSMSKKNASSKQQSSRPIMFSGKQNQNALTNLSQQQVSDLILAKNQNKKIGLDPQSLLQLNDFFTQPKQPEQSSNLRKIDDDSNIVVVGTSSSLIKQRNSLLTDENILSENQESFIDPQTNQGFQEAQIQISDQKPRALSSQMSATQRQKVVHNFILPKEQQQNSVQYINTQQSQKLRAQQALLLQQQVDLKHPLQSNPPQKTNCQVQCECCGRQIEQKQRSLKNVQTAGAVIAENQKISTYLDPLIQQQQMLLAQNSPTKSLDKPHQYLQQITPAQAQALLITATQQAQIQAANPQAHLPQVPQVYYYQAPTLNNNEQPSMHFFIKVTAEQIQPATLLEQQLHLFDQFGQHSPLCRCVKKDTFCHQLIYNNGGVFTQNMLDENGNPVTGQGLHSLGQNVRVFIDPYQRLNYIQQVCLQERYASQAHHALQQLQANQGNNLLNINLKLGNKNIKRGSMPNSQAQSNGNIVVNHISRLDQINQFIKKLNQLIAITLKATDSINPIALSTIKKLGQEIGIKWTSYLDAKFIKSKDFVTFLKSKIYILLNNLLMKNNVSLCMQVQLISNVNDKNLQVNKDEKQKEIKEKEQEKSPNKKAKKQEEIKEEEKEDKNVFVPGSTLDIKKLQQTPVGQIMAVNKYWLNQIQVYNILKFKNSGFKFWVEWPTVYCNNFIVVKQVSKRRTWLSWVNYDPYEERPDLQMPVIPGITVENNKKINHQNYYEPNLPKVPEAKPAGASGDKTETEESFEEEEYNEFFEYGTRGSQLRILPNLMFTQIKRIKIIQELMPHQIYNHIDGINQIAAKCQLHRNMNQYAIEVLGEDPTKIMPETYIVDLPDKATSAQAVLDNEEFNKFQKAFVKESWWIIKPGEDSNRGNGIKVFNNLQKIRDCIATEFNSGAKQYRTCIIQRYIEKPLLVHKRKFDIRVFALLTYNANFERKEGILRGWFYDEGYIRTSCKEFSLNQGDNPFIHLTNDAVQKNCQDYGKFEPGNKISYSDFDKLLIKEKQISFYQKILPGIKKRVSDVFKAAGKRLIGEVRSDYNGFEWLGLDFMIDDDCNISLIEVNTNPCLETGCCLLLQRLIPQMLDQSMKIAVDPFFGASEQQYLMNQEFVATEIKYSLVFEETIKDISNQPIWSSDYYNQQKVID